MNIYRQVRGKSDSEILLILQERGMDAEQAGDWLRNYRQSIKITKKPAGPKFTESEAWKSILERVSNLGKAGNEQRAEIKEMGSRPAPPKHGNVGEALQGLRETLSEPNGTPRIL